jgi:hypothetical protein
MPSDRAAVSHWSTSPRAQSAGAGDSPTVRLPGTPQAPQGSPHLSWRPATRACRERRRPALGTREQVPCPQVHRFPPSPLCAKGARPPGHCHGHAGCSPVCSMASTSLTRMGGATSGGENCSGRSGSVRPGRRGRSVGGAPAQDPRAGGTPGPSPPRALCTRTGSPGKTSGMHTPGEEGWPLAPGRSPQSHASSSPIGNGVFAGAGKVRMSGGPSHACGVVRRGHRWKSPFQTQGKSHIAFKARKEQADFELGLWKHEGINSHDSGPLLVVSPYDETHRTGCELHCLLCNPGHGAHPLWATVTSKEKQAGVACAPSFVELGTPRSLHMPGSST